MANKIVSLATFDARTSFSYVVKASVVLNKLFGDRPNETKESWELLVVVALSSATTFLVGSSGKCKGKKLFLEVVNCLASQNKGAVEAICNLETTDVDPRRGDSFYTELSFWLVWNLLNEKPESDDEMELVVKVANLLSSGASEINEAI